MILELDQLKWHPMEIKVRDLRRQSSLMLTHFVSCAIVIPRCLLVLPQTARIPSIKKSVVYTTGSQCLALVDPIGNIDVSVSPVYSSGLVNIVIMLIGCKTLDGSDATVPTPSFGVRCSKSPRRHIGGELIGIGDGIRRSRKPPLKRLE